MSHHNAHLLLLLYLSMGLTASYADSESLAEKLATIPSKNTIYGVYAVDDPKRASIVGNAVAVDKHTMATPCSVAFAYPDLITGVDEKVTYTHVVYVSPKKELCLLDVPYRELHPANMRPTKKVNLKEPIFGIGSPSGSRLELSLGSVQAINNANGDPVLETDAAMTDDEVGAGLFDKNYNLIGIVFFDPSHSDNTYALSTELITAGLEKLKTEPKKLN